MLNVTPIAVSLPRRYLTKEWRMQDLTNEQLEMIANLTEARILNISKDDLRMSEVQLLWTPALEKMVYEYWSTLNGYWKNKQLPKCTCGDYEINAKTGKGFMADPRYNPYFYEEEPCSLEWAQKTKKEGLWQHPDEKK